MKRGDLDKRVMITLFCLRTTKTCCKIRRPPSDRPRRLMNLQESGQRQRKNPFFWSVACRRPTSEIHIIRNLDCNNKPTFRRLTKRRTHVRPFFYYNEPHLRCEPILAGSYSIFFWSLSSSDLVIILAINWREILTPLNLTCAYKLMINEVTRIVTFSKKAKSSFVPLAINTYVSA